MKTVRICLIALIAAACGSSPTAPTDSGTPPVPAPVITSFVGTWNLMATVTAGAAFSVGTKYPVTLSLNQNGTSVTGTFSASTVGSSGTVTADVTGSNIALTIHQTAPCTSTFTGSGSMSGVTLTGSYSGTDCARTLTVTFTGIR